MGSIYRLYYCSEAKAEMIQAESLNCVMDRGIEGDRYFLGKGTFSQELSGTPDDQITLIESEEIDQFNHDNGLNLSYGSFRRNIITTGIKLNPLVGQKIQIGDVVLEAIRYCEPCAHLAQLLGQEILPQMMGRSGLRAKIISGGVVKSGQPITAVTDGNGVS